MKRLTEAWFEFKGIKSTDMGVQLRAMPTRFIPARNYTRKPVGGRDGKLRFGDGKYGDAKARIECSVPDAENVTKVLAWLSGSGKLRFSDEPEFVYTGSVEAEYSRASIMTRFEGQRFTVTWVCEPFRKQHTEADPIPFYTSGFGLINPGTAPALPRVEIIGNGDFSLTIGMETMFFTGISGGIIVDSELMDALSLDGKELLNNNISGTPFEIQPGENTVQWLLGEGANIESVTITPRWRYI